MKLKPILLAATAALALGACGKKEGAGAPETKSSAAAARADAGSPLDAPYRLKDAEALDVDALLALLPEGARPAYDSAKFDAALGATVLTNLRFVDQNPDDDIEFDGVAIDRAELYGVDMEAVERIKAATDAAVDAPFEKVFDKVRLFGLKPVNAEDRNVMTVGAAELDGFRLRQGGFKDGDENPAFFFNAFDLAGLYFKDIDADAAEGEGAGASDFAFKAKDLRFVGLGGGKLSAVIANGFEYEIEQSDEARAALLQSMGGPAAALLGGPLKGFIAPNHQRVVVKSFEWRGADMSGLMAYGLKREKPPLSARDLIDLGTARIVGTETYIDGRLAAIAAESTIDAFEFTWLAPSKFRSTAKGAEYDFTAYVAPEEEEAIAILKKHGLDKVKGEGAMSWDWDAGKGDAALVSDFKSTQLADFSLDFAMNGLALDKISALLDEGEANPVVKLGAFKGFGLKIADKMLLDVGFELGALGMEGTSADDLRQSAPAMIRLSGMQAAAMSPRIGGYVDAIANFVEQGGTIEIAARPQSPVALEAIDAASEAGPQTIPDLINLTVTHTPKK
jgi:hypothetical protein